MQEKILVICPSRGRPKQCLAMVNSFLATSRQSTLKICLDMDDPCIMEYQDLLGGKASLSMGMQRSITQIINEHWRFSADCFRWFSVTNDDFIYQTDGWDETMINTLKLHGGQGIIYGNDLLQGIRLPTTSIVTREIVQALGWLQMPLLTHLFGDNVWAHLGQRAGCLLYRPDVIIEHRHWNGNKSPLDETYKRVNSAEMFRIDQEAFLKWINTEADSDISKVKSIVEPVFRKA